MLQEPQELLILWSPIPSRALGSRNVSNIPQNGIGYHLGLYTADAGLEVQQLCCSLLGLALSDSLFPAAGGQKLACTAV